MLIGSENGMCSEMGWYGADWVRMEEEATTRTRCLCCPVSFVLKGSDCESVIFRLCDVPSLSGDSLPAVCGRAGPFVV